MKKLYRSNTTKIISGVCGGIAEYFNIDARFVRLLFIISLFFGFFPPILVYAALATIVTPDPIRPFDKKAQTSVIDAEIIEKKPPIE
jgi:phage shock protein C